MSSNRSHNINFKTYLAFPVLFLLALIIMLRQLVTDGYFSCIIEDSYTFTSWAWQFIEALKEGIVYPRWLPLNFWGYGSPTFILYPPLAFYLVAFFNIFTGSVIMAMNMTKFFALFLSGVGMFFLVREFYSEKIALLSACFYIVFPYYIFGLYFVGTFSSMISLMWFSPILLFTYRYIENRQYKNIVYASICYGGLLMTHLINAYMFTFIIIAFTIFLSINKKRPRALTAIPFLVIIGFLLSAVYILPLIYEKQFVQIETFVGEGGGFDFKNFFILPNATGKIPPDRFWPVYYNTYIFFIIFFCLLFLLFLLEVFKLRRHKIVTDINSINKFFLCVAIGSLILLFGITTPLWEILPFFKYIQFPHRWLNITTFAFGFLSAALFTVLDVFHKQRRRYFFIGVLFLTSLLFDYKYISTAPFFYKHVLIPVKSANLNTEHLPRGISLEKIACNSDLKDIKIIRGEGKAEIIVWKSAERVITIAARKQVTLRIKTFYFPGWGAKMDGKKIEIKTEEGTGAMLVDIPEGTHRLELRFEDTLTRYYSKLVSLFSFVVIICSVFFLKRQKQA